MEGMSDPVIPVAPHPRAAAARLPPGPGAGAAVKVSVSTTWRPAPKAITPDFPVIGQVALVWVFEAEIPGTAAIRRTSPSSSEPVTTGDRCYPEALRPPILVLRLSDASPVSSKFRGLAYVAGDRVAQLGAAPAGADVTRPRVHVDLDQAGERPAGDRRLGIGGLGPRLQGELFGGHAGEAAFCLFRLFAAIDGCLRLSVLMRARVSRVLCVVVTGLLVRWLVAAAPRPARPVCLVVEPLVSDR
jgi:hypothetical protein